MSYTDFDPNNLIYDRTQSDVDYVKAQTEKWYLPDERTSTFIAEWEEYNYKGAYNYTDINRVTDGVLCLGAIIQRGQEPLSMNIDKAIETYYVAQTGLPWNEDAQRKFGYDKEPPQILEELHTDYEVGDIVYYEDAVALLSAIKEMANLIGYEVYVPENMDNLTYKDANDIEKALWDLYQSTSQIVSQHERAIDDFMGSSEYQYWTNQTQSGE